MCVGRYGACNGSLAMFFGGVRVDERRGEEVEGGDVHSWSRPEECVEVHSCPVLSLLCTVLSV